MIPLTQKLKLLSIAYHSLSIQTGFPNLCKGTSIHVRQISKCVHLSGCPISYIVIHHLPSKLLETRKFMKEKWCYLAPLHGQHSTITANTSSIFSQSLSGNDSNTNIVAQMKSLGKVCFPQQKPIQQNSQHTSQPHETCHHCELLFILLQLYRKKGVYLHVCRCKSSNREVIQNLHCPRHFMWHLKALLPSLCRSPL